MLSDGVAMWTMNNPMAPLSFNADRSSGTNRGGTRPVHGFGNPPQSIHSDPNKTCEKNQCMDWVDMDHTHETHGSKANNWMTPLGAPFWHRAGAQPGQAHPRALQRRRGRHGNNPIQLRGRGSLRARQLVPGGVEPRPLANFDLQPSLRMLLYLRSSHSHRRRPPSREASQSQRQAIARIR